MPHSLGEFLILCYTFTYRGKAIFVLSTIRGELITNNPRTAINIAIVTAIIDAMVQVLFVRRAWYCKHSPTPNFSSNLMSTK